MILKILPQALLPCSLAPLLSHSLAPRATLAPTLSPRSLPPSLPRSSDSLNSEGASSEGRTHRHRHRYTHIHARTRAFTNKHSHTHAHARPSLSAPPSLSRSPSPSCCLMIIRHPRSRGGKGGSMGPGGRGGREVGREAWPGVWNHSPSPPPLSSKHGRAASHGDAAEKAMQR
jgi:hypothetical protein